jgi:hypothetical protein
MPSRRRSRNKNLGNNLADVQRRLRNMERRPVRTKLQNRVVTTAAIAVNAVGPDEVSFGTTVITSDPVNTIENPKDGLLVVNETTGTTSVYSEQQGDYLALPAVDTTARDDAETAQLTADGKNKIFRQNNAPTTAESSAGDLWYDQDDGNKMYRYVGSPTNAWAQAVVLGTNAVANLNASVITAGTIDANAISVINLNAANISTGDLQAARIATTALNANNITAGVITGRTLRTSAPATGDNRRIEVTAEDDMIFYNDNNTRMGTITSVNAGSNSAPGTPDDVYVDDGILIYGGPAAVDQGTPIFPSIVASDTSVGLIGGANSIIAATGQSTIYGPSHTNYADEITLLSGYSETDGVPWRVEISGRLVLSEDLNQGPLSQGAGQPPSTAADNLAYGQIVFRYT